MTTTTNAENLQYKSRFSLIAEQTLAFFSNTNLVRKVKKTIWNDLQRLTMRKKRPETTYKEQEMIWNDIQQAVNDLKWPTTSTTQPTTTWTYQQWAK